jgi:hypothetical protein
MLDVSNTATPGTGVIAQIALYAPPYRILDNAARARSSGLGLCLEVEECGLVCEKHAWHVVGIPFIPPPSTEALDGEIWAVSRNSRLRCKPGTTQYHGLEELD